MVIADSARAAGRVTFNILLILGLIFVLVGYGRRRARGERALGWLVGACVLGFLVLGLLAEAAQR